MYYVYSDLTHIDIDECSLDPSLCSYMCENVEGTYNCICPPGQKLLADQKSCAGTHLHI